MIGTSFPYSIALSNPSCTLYGSTSYTNSFLGINFLVILAGFAIVAFVYMLSRFMPASLSGKMTAVTRVEIVELVISALIIMMVIAFALGACTISSAISTSVSGSGSSPLVFSDEYLGTLTFNTGLTLLTSIYTYSIAYSIDGNLYGSISNLLAKYLPLIIPEEAATEAADEAGAVFPITFEFPFGYDLGILYSILGALFLVALAPLVITALGMLFVQWLSMPVIQATAFVIVLPVAIALRSFAYAAAGPGLRQAANTFLALAIAAYIVYPLAVSFDPCIISWVYGQPSCLGPAGSNPASQYLTPYAITSLSPGEFSSLGSGSYQTSGGSIQIPALSIFLSAGEGIGLPALNPFATIAQLQTLIDSISQFVFIAIFLFALDLAITFAFAMGLTRALNSGIEGEARFWSE